jgi:transposase-like protein
MKKSRFSEEKIISILREADAGVNVAELARKHGISPATYYQWKSEVRRARCVAAAALEGARHGERQAQEDVRRAVVEP